MKKRIISAMLSFIMLTSVTLALCAANAAGTIKWNGEPDKAVAVNVDVVQNDTRKNSSGTKISSNALSTEFPGIYFIWDSKQKDNGYLKVDASVLYQYEYFVLTAKEANLFWDFKIEPQAGQMLTEDGCYVFFIPKASGNKNINSVFIDEWKELPEIDIAVEGNFKVNRKITAYGTTEDGLGLFERVTLNGTVTISVTPMDDGIPSAAVVIDATTERDDFKEFIVKQAGDYEAVLTFTRLEITKTVSTVITVEEDLAPVADFSVEEFFYRDSDGVADISVADLSFSPDGDEIGARLWKIVHDVNNDGSFSGEEITLEDETDIDFSVNDVGFYRISLVVTETYDDTIPALLSDEDYLSGVCEKVFEVRNQAPSISGSFGKEMRLDIVAAFGDVSLDRTQGFRDALSDVKDILESRGVKTRLGGVLSQQVTTTDAFAWQIYEHTNYRFLYTTPQPPNRAHSIEIKNNGTELTMYGYNTEMYKDFLFLPDTDPGEKVFTFDLVGGSNNWHSMEGGGFLFNTSIENGRIEGYCILVTLSGLRLSKVSATLTDMMANLYNNMSQYGQLINQWPMNFGNSSIQHSFKIVVSPTQISVWVDDAPVVSEYTLPASTKFGFGPIASHSSHGCSQISWFTFSNLTMVSTQKYRLSDTLGEYSWNTGDASVLVHMSDGAVPEFEEAGAMGQAIKSILNKEILYVGVSGGESDEQLSKIADNASGIVLDGEDIGAFASELADILYEYAVSVAAANPGIYYVDDTIWYAYEYSDPENDAMSEVVFRYDHNPGYFSINDGAIDGNNVYGASKEQLKKVGQYSLYIKASDLPSANAALALAYSLSAELLLGDILVVNRPIAALDENLAYVAHAPNRIGEDSDGIAVFEWKWKSLDDENWIIGKPGTLPAGGEYLVSLRVQDVDGVWSKSAVVYISK